MLKIANGASEHSNSVVNKTISWEQILARLSKPRIQPRDRSYMLTGQCPSGIRGKKKGDAITESHLLMVDLDSEEALMTWQDFVFSLAMDLPFKWAAYTSRSYNGSNVRFRLIVPFASGLEAKYHRSAVEYIESLLPDAIKPAFDRCSLTVDQPIFLPCIKEDGNPFHFENGGEEYFDPASLDLEADEDWIGEDDALEAALMSEPLDLTEEEIQLYLDQLDPNAYEYGLDQGVFGWGNVGAALAHQFRKGDRGFEIWVEWSKRNREKHNLKGMRHKYDSFEVMPRGHRPITFASVIDAVKRQGGAVAKPADGGKSNMDKLIDRANEIETLEQYNEFRQEVSKMSGAILSDDMRQVLAHEVVNAIGKKFGLTKGVVGKAFAPKKITSVAEGRSLPGWLEGWSYIEKQCEFYHLPTNHNIKKEAFNARYNRMSECIIDERSADHLALVKFKIPTYADKMYWPGAGDVFEYEGKAMVNDYVPSGVVPAKSIDAQGQRAVDLFLKHTEMLIPDERERRILLDWLAYVYQNPGKRINWAILLQGAQGAGKSYYATLMGLLLGSNMKTLEAAAVAGRFTAWATGSVLTVMEEVRVNGSSKYEVMDRMKPFITNPTIQIERKGLDHQVVPNFTNYLMLSNHKDALPIGDNDRRYCPIYSAIQSEGQLFKLLGGREGADLYFQNLFGSMEDHPDALAAFMRDFEISEDFSPSGRAPITQASETMKALSKSPLQQDIESALIELECEVINDRIVDATHFQSLCEGHGIELPKTSGFSSVMLEMGFEPISSRVKIGKKLHRIWIRPEAIKIMDAVRLAQNFHERVNGDGNQASDPEDCPF